MLSTAFWSRIRHVILPNTPLRSWRPISSSVSTLCPYTTSLSIIGRPLKADSGKEDVEDLNDKFVNAYASRRVQSPRNVFEDLTDEYARQAKSSLHDDKPSISQTNEAPVNVNQVLERLILKRDFEGAGAAKRELLDAGISLGKDLLYLRAAQHYLERRADPTYGKIFLEWWSLVPDDAMRLHMPHICTTLMQQPVQMDLVTEFALLCAKAGHANEVGVKFLPFISRYLDVEPMLQFIQSLLDQSREKILPSRTFLLNRAARYYFIAGRRVEGFRIVEQIRKEELEVKKRTVQAVSRNHIDETQRLFSPPRVVLPRVPLGRIAIPPSPEAMAKNLRRLRQAVKSVYCENMASFAAFFIITYEGHYQRTRAVRILRERVFRNGALPVQSAWVAAEQLAYCRRGRPLAVLRSFLHYCLPAHVPVKKLHEILEIAEERMGTGKKRWFDVEGSESELFPIKCKFWPNVASLSAVWKSAIHLADSRVELESLYAAMLSPLEKRYAGRQPALADSLGQNVVTAPPGAELPDAVVFHHFITAFATRYGGKHGASILVDMSRLGVKQSIENWTVLAGVYARSADVERANDILTFLETSFRPSDNAKSVDDLTYRSNMIVAYNSAMRGYIECAMYEEARRVQERMGNLGYFDLGVSKRTRSILHRLSRSEKGKYYERLERTRRSCEVKGRKLYIDPRRVDWIR